jgi:hypothetical protein
LKCPRIGVARKSGPRGRDVGFDAAILKALANVSIAIRAINRA